MGCCSKEKDGEIFKPRGARGCTDLLCLLGLICGIGGLIGLAAISVNKQPSLMTDLVYPKDSYGNNCGNPGTATAYMPKVIFPMLDADIQAQMPIIAAQQYWLFKPTKMCAATCPSGFSMKNPVQYGGAAYPSPLNMTVPSLWYTYNTQDVIGQCFPLSDSVPRAAASLCATPNCYDQAVNASLDGSLRCVKVDSQPDADNIWEVCPPGTDAAPGTALCERQRTACALEVNLKVTDTFSPAGQTDDSAMYTKALASYTQTVVGAVEGLLVTKGITVCSVCGLGIPIALGFTWAIFLWMFAGVFVWCLLILEITCMIVLSAWLALKAGWFDSVAVVATTLSSATNSSLTSSAEGTEQTWFMVAAIIAIILTVLNILFVVMSLRAISRLIAIIRECTKVFKSMFLIVFWPMWSVVLRFFIFLGGLLAFYFLFYVWQESETWIYYTILVCHVLGVLWLIEFVRALNWASMAGAVGYWFVTDNAPGGEGSCCPQAGFGALTDSTITMCLKHLGSFAFGALVIAVVRTLQLILYLVDYMTKNQQKENLMLKLAMKCLMCCLWCLRKTVEFVSNKGFIFVAIEGTGFCRSCFNTFAFIIKYPAQTAVNAIVQKMLGLLIGLSTPVLCALIAFFWLDNDAEYKENGYNPLWAAMVVALCAYIVADGICIVFDVSIDTIYLCSFKDMEENNPPRFMSDNLRSGFGLDADAAAKDSGASRYDGEGGAGKGTKGNQVAPRP